MFWDILCFKWDMPGGWCCRSVAGPATPALPAIEFAPLPAPTLISLTPSDRDRACCSLVICPHECVDAVRRVPAAGAVGYQVCPRAYSNADILYTPSPSLQQYGNVNADLPTWIAAAPPPFEKHSRIFFLQCCPFFIRIGWFALFPFIERENTADQPIREKEDIPVHF